jgi:two-component system, chemotaxis family, chemotaxis protein CheY
MALDMSMPILVVDDNPTVLGILVSLLRKIGFMMVDVAPDGSAALARMRAKRYGLVISDWQMEPMDGYTFLKEIRSDQTLAATPFIMITLHSEAKKVVSAKNAGVNGYLSKPFTAKALSSKIELALAGRTIAQEA